MNKDKLYGFIKFYSRAKVVFKLFIDYYKFKKTVITRKAFTGISSINDIE
jgi:hypothetical protein